MNDGPSPYRDSVVRVLSDRLPPWVAYRMFKSAFTDAVHPPHVSLRTCYSGVSVRERARSEVFIDYLGRAYLTSTVVCLIICTRVILRPTLLDAGLRGKKAASDTGEDSNDRWKGIGCDMQKMREAGT